MRIAGLLAVAAMLAACSTGGESTGADGALGPSPFAVERGSALPPPAPAASAQNAPPEGRTQGGLDFGQWRSADPATYGPALQSQMRVRYDNQEISQIRTDLEANGFACEGGSRLDCRIEIMERQCAHDWYVVVERNRAEPIAGYDLMCLGAQ